MSEFLDLFKQSQLTDEAISLYINCVGKLELTKDELISSFPQLTSENFTTIINELIDSNLFIHITSKKPEYLEYYIAIPPFSILLENISNINEITTSNQELINNSIARVFKGDQKLN